MCLPVFIPGGTCCIIVIQSHICENCVVAKKKKSRKKKKESQLVIRLDGDMRDQFVDACQELDTTASRELRQFIKKFLIKYKNGELGE